MSREPAFISYLRNNRNHFKKSWSLSWPMLLIMFFEFSINLADVYIAGLLGKEYQATVGFTSQMYFILIVIGNAMTVGTVAVVSRQFSSVDRKRCSETVYSILVTVGVAGTILGILGIFLTPIIVAVLNVPASVKNLGAPLLEIYAAGLLFHYVLINTNGILRATGGVKKSMVTMGIVSVTNVGLNFFLVFRTGLGYHGIAISTAVSVLIGAILNVYFIWPFLDGIKKFSREIIRKIISIGWPFGLLQIAWQVGYTVLYLIISALPAHNVEIMAAMTNGLRVESAIFMPAFALNLANAVVVGNLLGENRHEDAIRGGTATAVIGVVIATTLCVLVIPNARIFASMLSSNELVIDESVRYIYISLIAEPFLAWSIILGGGLNGAGDTRAVMRIIALSIWLVRIPLSVFLALGLELGPVSIWWSMNASIFVHATFITKRYFKKKWLYHE